MQQEVSGRKADIEERLKRGEKISDDETDWLDNDANLVDESLLIQDLSGTSDLPQALEGLEEPEQILLERMKTAAGLSEISPAKKRKSTYLDHLSWRC